MGSVLSSEGREVASSPDARGHREGIQCPQPLGTTVEEEAPQQSPSFDCSICLEVLHQPMRTRCGHVFCHSCIATSLRNNTWTCPYCRAYLHSEGIPATDITKMMKNIYQNCTECDTEVCLSEMRAHLRTCAQYIEKYGPLQEVEYPITRYPCPFCQYELDENDLLDHYLTYHRSERRAVYCPICRLLPDGGPSYYSRNFIRHLQLRHTFYYEDYIDITIVEEALIERVLDRSFIEYVHVNNANTAQS
ncbi:E3 ubiquitin-protein ligase RNF125 [Eublepharis macularius]|uniref:RING-type E3 ubiquitin transferase n=1 Tax=Eublepharis macularius TaxID=481883 RepID=A0AA97JQU3_EUBMA|nr:E3 ubiquitin-protein ligase RNF125 [Eublepharis macularius]